MTIRERVESPLRSPAGTDIVPSEPSPRLRLRELTGWEEEFVERHQSDANTSALCNEILARCSVPPGADPAPARQTVRDLLVAERDRELVELRRISLGPDVSALVDCPRCGGVNDAEFSLDALPLDFEPVRRRFAVELPGVGEVWLRAPTAGDQADLLDAGLEGESERRTWLLARCLDRYGAEAGELDVAFTRALPVRVRSALESAIEANLPRLELEMAVECSHCQAAFGAPFDVSVFFFRMGRAREGPEAGGAPRRPGVPLDREGHPGSASPEASGLPAPARGGRGRPAPGGPGSGGFVLTDALEGR